MTRLLTIALATLLLAVPAFAANPSVTGTIKSTLWRNAKAHGAIGAWRPGMRMEITPHGSGYKVVAETTAIRVGTPRRPGGPPVRRTVAAGTFYTNAAGTKLTTGTGWGFLLGSPGPLAAH